MNIKKLEEGIERLERGMFGFKRIMTLPELAVYIGLAESYIYKLTSRNVIPHYQPLGKTIYFDRYEIDDWILKNKVPSKQEIERKANAMILRRSKS
jgi:excisionase family DNA binding protein